MKKITIILLCIMLNIGTYGVTYSSTYKGNVTGYYTTYPATSTYSYQYEFKSTSSYTPMTSYQTVKPVGNDGFVSDEYTTNNSYRPRNVRKGLDLEDEDEPTGGTVPIGDPDIYVIASIFLLYLFYHIVKSKKIQNVTRN